MLDRLALRSCSFSALKITTSFSTAVTSLRIFLASTSMAFVSVSTFFESICEWSQEKHTRKSSVALHLIQRTCNWRRIDVPTRIASVVFVYETHTPVDYIPQEHHPCPSGFDPSHSSISSRQQPPSVAYHRASLTQYHLCHLKLQPLLSHMVNQLPPGCWLVQQHLSCQCGVPQIHY